MIMPLFRKLTTNKNIIILEMIANFSPEENEIFEKSEDPNFEKEMNKILENHIKNADSKNLKKPYAIKPSKEDGITPYMMKEVYSEQKIKFNIIAIFFKLMITKKWITYDDVVVFLKTEKMIFLESTINLRALVSLMNIVVYLHFFSIYHEDVDILHEVKQFRKHQKKTLLLHILNSLGKIDIGYDDLCEKISFFMHNVLDEDEKKKVENKNLYNEKEDEEIEKKLKKNNKEKLSKILKELWNSNLKIATILKEAKFFSFINDYDLGVMASPNFVKKYFYNLYTSFELQDILRNVKGGATFPKWGFDLNTLKSFLIFNLGFEKENIEKQEDHILKQKLIDFYNHLNYIDSTPKSQHVPYFSLSPVLDLLYGVAAAEAAMVVAEGAAAGAASAVILGPILIGSIVSAAFNDKSIEKKYELNSTSRKDVNENGIKLPKQRMKSEEICELNKKLIPTI